MFLLFVMVFNALPQNGWTDGEVLKAKTVYSGGSKNLDGLAIEGIWAKCLAFKIVKCVSKSP